MREERSILLSQGQQKLGGCGRGGWSLLECEVRASIWAWLICCGPTLMAESSGCYTPALLLWLCALETVRNGFFGSKGNLLGLGGLNHRAHALKSYVLALRAASLSPCPERPPQSP